MTGKLRVGVVGIGFGQQILVPAFRADARCEIAALCASTLERARVVAERLEVPKAYGDWQELVADPDTDAIAVAVPPSIQPAIVIAALAHCKHVFCEKPLATTRKAAADMLGAARHSGMAHMVDFEFPEIEAWRRAKTIMESGALGRLRHGVVSWLVETYTNRMGLKSWKASPEDGGGALNLFASHTFHYLEWLIGPIQSLSARLFSCFGSVGQARGDTLAILCLEHAGGIPVSVSVSSNSYLGMGHRVEIYADNGSLVLENTTSDYVSGFRLLHGTRETRALKIIHTESPTSTGTDGRIIATGRLVERFANWARGGAPSAPTLEDGYRVQCLLDAARKGNVEGTWLDVSCNNV